MRKTLTKLTLTVILLLAFATMVQAAPTTYSVQSGDSLWKISKNTGISVNKIKELNGLSSDMLRVGQVLTLQSSSSNIPASVTPSPQSIETAPAVYTIQAGDSLWSIAQKHGTSVGVLIQLNGLSNDNLQVGNTLKVGGATPVQVSRSGERNEGTRVVEYARKYVGTPYAYGGMSPKGFDCSGFAKYVMSSFQVSLPRTAAEQYSVGTAIESSNLQAGDLVFFCCGGGSINHVGISCGNGTFVHSSSPRSGGVIMSSLSEGYYANCYVGAKRVLP